MKCMLSEIAILTAFEIIYVSLKRIPVNRVSLLHVIAIYNSVV